MITDNSLLKGICDDDGRTNSAMFYNIGRFVQFFLFVKNTDLMFNSLDHFLNTMCIWIGNGRDKILFGDRYVGTVADVSRNPSCSILVDGYIEFASYEDVLKACDDLQKNYSDNLILFSDGNVEACFGVIGIK